MTPALAAETTAPGGGDGSRPRGEGGTGDKNDEIEESEDVATTGNKIVVTPVAEALMDAIAALADADGPSAVTVMLLDEDCEEGEEDNEVADEVMRELWRDDEDEDEDDGGKVEGKDGNGGVIDNEEDGGGAR
jgi:hypothetical protein